MQRYLAICPLCILWFKCYSVGRKYHDFLAVFALAHSIISEINLFFFLLTLKYLGYKISDDWRNNPANRNSDCANPGHQLCQPATTATDTATSFAATASVLVVDVDFSWSGSGRMKGCPKYTLFFRVAHTLFVHLFGARLWTSYSVSRLFKKVFASWPLSGIKKDREKVRALEEPTAPIKRNRTK